MKTLDEVIKALRCTNPETDPETKCNDCPYKEFRMSDLWYVGPSCLDVMFADALHYLKEYSSNQDTIAEQLEELEQKNDHVCEMAKTICEEYDRLCNRLAEEYRNDPLTWDELKAMEGKPVWVEQTMIFEEGTPEEYQQDVKEWMIISAIHNKQGWVDMVDVEDGELQFDRKDNTWKAYRKERG